MPALRQYQAGFSRFLLTGEREGLDQFLVPMGFSGDKTFHDFATIYRNNVRISLREALAKTFPATQALVGEEFFAFAANNFIAAHPPVTPVLAWFGDGFSAFLRTLEGLFSYPYVPEIAAFEWALNVARIAEGGIYLSAEEFASGISGEGEVSLSPAVTLLASEFFLPEIREFALGETGEAPSVKPGDKIHLIVYRHNEVVRHETLSQGTFEILARIQTGENLSAVLAEPIDPNLYETTIGEMGWLFAEGVFVNKPSRRKDQ